MHNECFSPMSKTLERCLFFSQGSSGAAKMNSYLNIPVHSLISPSNTKYEDKINTQ